jgi:GTP cyclohydrolase I
MHDVQNETDHRGIEVDEVGIAGLRYPILFEDGQLRQQAVAEIAVTVRLQADRRGTHMSRMVALVHNQLQVFNPQHLPQVLKAGAYDLDAPSITIAITLPVATPVIAPISRIESLMVHDVTIVGSMENGTCKVTSSVMSEVTSLCPCSKTISDYGAHNQRSKVTLSIVGVGDNPYPMTVSGAIELLKTSGSAPVIPLVKRPDERALTMQAYDHPTFVEDMVRHVSSSCRSRGLSHRVHVRNLESIHSHDAVALIIDEQAQ